MTDSDVEARAKAAVARHRPNGAAIAESPWPEDDPGPPEPPDSSGDREPETPLLADKLLTRTALRTLPDPQPAIENTIDQGTVALLYGRWGTAKSFIALDWAACVATARPWQGRPATPGKVLYVAAEGAFGFKNRVDAWELGWKTTIRDDALLILPVPVNLTRAREVNELAALITWGNYSFIVLDTLARCMVGADENSARDCGIVVDAMTTLRHHTPSGRGVILGVHHAGKDGKTFRGSSVFEAGADTVYSSNRDGGVITLNREKRKDGPEQDRHELKLDPIRGTGSCCISAGNLSTQGVDKLERADRLLSTFVHHFSHTGASKAELRNVADMPPATFHRALGDLLKCGDLTNVGTEKRPFYKAAVS
ncbi:hypothetical protein A5647_14305 [Mycobacterium sp. 1100029.7]|nr:hypothetical protein A5647_14305 [Mycobacterium sp. 1100029.7]